MSCRSGQDDWGRARDEELTSVEGWGWWDKEEKKNGPGLINVVVEHSSGTRQPTYDGTATSPGSG